MSTPDSVHPAVLLPVIPRLTIAPARTSHFALSQSIASLPPALVATAGLVLIQTVAFFGSRILAVSLSYRLLRRFDPDGDGLGALSFLSIILVSSAIVLGHASLRTARSSGVWMRQAAAIVPAWRICTSSCGPHA